MKCGRCQQETKQCDLLCKYCGYDLRAPAEQAAWSRPASGVLQKLVRPPHLPDLRQMITAKTDSVIKETAQKANASNQCKKCGKVNRAGSQFCSDCGSPIEENPSSKNNIPVSPPGTPGMTNTPKEDSPRKMKSTCLISILVGLATFTVVCLVGFVGYSVLFS